MIFLVPALSSTFHLNNLPVSIIITFAYFLLFSLFKLDCSHVFHLQCCRRVLENRWLGPRITFGFISCPICKVWKESSFVFHLSLYLSFFRINICLPSLLLPTALISSCSPYLGGIWKYYRYLYYNAFQNSNWQLKAS